MGEETEGKPANQFIRKTAVKMVVLWWMLFSCWWS